MSALTEPIAKRMAKLFAQLASDYENVQLIAIAAMKRELANNGLSFNDLAVLIENANGEIEHLKYSDSDAEAIFTRGVEEGRKQNTGLETDFVNNDGTPRWLEMATFCNGSPSKIALEPRERDFIEEMIFKMQRYGAPKSEKQGVIYSVYFFDCEVR